MTIAAIALGFPLVCWFLGWSALGRVDGLRSAERFAASFGVAFALLAAGAFLAFLTGAPRLLFHAGFLAVLLVAALCLWRRRAAEPEHGLGFFVAVCALAYLHLLGVQMLLPQ